MNVSDFDEGLGFRPVVTLTRGRVFAYRPNSAGVVVPAYRVKAWRKPDEDMPDPAIVATRQARQDGLGSILFTDAQIRETYQHWNDQDRRNKKLLAAIQDRA